MVIPGRDVADTDGDEFDKAAIEIAPKEREQPQPNNAPPVKTIPPVWHDAAKPLQADDVRIKITRVETGKVSLRLFVGGETSVSKKELLAVWVEIKNISLARKIDYTGWMSGAARSKNIEASLTDNYNNNYQAVEFGTNTTVQETQNAANVQPTDVARAREIGNCRWRSRKPNRQSSRNVNHFSRTR